MRAGSTRAKFKVEGVPVVLEPSQAKIITISGEAPLKKLYDMAPSSPSESNRNGYVALLVRALDLKGYSFQTYWTIAKLTISPDLVVKEFEPQAFDADLLAGVPDSEGRRLWFPSARFMDIGPQPIPTLTQTPVPTPTKRAMHGR